MEFWSIIVKSNTFNFLIMIGLFAFIIIKFRLVEKLENAVLKVKETIDNSQKTKDNSLEELSQAIEKTQHTKEEIKEIEDISKENIFNTTKRIALEAENQVEGIKKSAQKVMDAKEKEVISNLSKKTILASFDVAYNHIVNLLKQNPAYHQKFIKESIEELNRLK